MLPVFPVVECWAIHPDSALATNSLTPSVASFGCLDPVTQGLINWPQVLCHRAYRLTSLGLLHRQLFEPGRVFLASDILCHPWKTIFRGKVIDIPV